MVKSLVAAALGSALALAAPVALAAPSEGRAASGSAPGGSQCPEKAPEGAVFVKRVQPPLGLPYEVWRLPSGQLKTVYC
ncbi:hypothetical protein [Saccharothrix xinjiangensis]|uniref:Uncharacterized protein n=1 Tax=Saccharothrix xinjiangensis TaxID=204798 RepID=A0ABV9Y233_9PSEU